MNLSQLKLTTKLGPIYLVASDEAVVGLYWEQQDVPMASNGVLKRAHLEVREYFEGKRTRFEVPFTLEGTEFQQKVWKEVKKIPFGKTVSYQQIAERVGTNGVRAVGTAIGRNPICLLVPCHRVIGKNGGLGGYVGGLELKRRLLDLERRG